MRGVWEGVLKLLIAKGGFLSEGIEEGGIEDTKMQMVLDVDFGRR